MVWLDGQDLEDWWQGNLGHRYVGEPLWIGADWRYLSPMSVHPKGGHCRGSYNEVDKILCSVAIRELLYIAAMVPALWMPMKRPCSRDRGCGPNRTPSVKAELANAGAEGLFYKCQWFWYGEKWILPEGNINVVKKSWLKYLMNSLIMLNVLI